ncbi:Phage integrase family protein [Lentzea flava]|nr:Phage integrase family protein [Lentzea flava]
MNVAVLWKYISLNPIRSVKAPSVPRRNHSTWTPEQMMLFLEHVRHHRWYALWVLEASTGVRRSELCGVEIAAFGLSKKVVRMAATTRVIAAGKAVKGSGKSQKSRRLLALDSFTTGVLTVHFQQLEKEKQDWGDAYQDHGLAFCWEDGRPIYPDTITEEFNKIVDFLGLPKIRFHDSGTPTRRSHCARVCTRRLSALAWGTRPWRSPSTPTPRTSRTLIATPPRQ